MSRTLNLHIIILIALIIPSVAFSQTRPVTITNDSALVKQPVAIAVIDIIDKLTTANAELKEIEEKIALKNKITAIDSLLPQYVTFIEQRKLLEQNFIIANPNRQKIDNLLIQWLGYRVHLESWQASINDSEISNEILRDRIADSEIIWKLTYENAAEEDIPYEILNSTKKLWNDYKRINTVIKDEKNKFLNLENKINNQVIVIDSVIDELNSLKNSDVYDIFYLRHLPFWEKSTEQSISNTPKKVGVESMSENVSSTIRYVESLGNALYLFLTTLIFLIVGLFLIKRSFLKYPIEGSNENLLKAKEITVNRTVWGLLFLTLILLRLFFPNTPKLFQDVLVLFMLTCATALVRPYLNIKFKNIPYFFILVLFLDLVKTYIWLSSFEYRLYLLFEAFLILWILMYLTYSYRKTRNSKFVDSIFIRFIPFVYILVIVSLISNILGYTNLTDFIIKLCIQGGDLTLIFYALFLMLNTMVLGFMHYHFNTRSTQFNLDNKLAIDLKLQRYIKAFTLLLWLFYFLNLFDIYRPLIAFFTDIFSEPFKVGDITFTLGMVLMFVTILAISYLITSIISFLLDGNELKIFFIQLPKGVPAAISLVIRYFILAFGFVLALSVLGIDLSKFNLLAGALGLGIGFGLQTIVSNFISGIILIFERPILTGDVVEVNNLIGTVSKIGVRASRISTYEGAEVVVPNNNLISKDLINWTLSDNIKRVEILIGVSYDSNPSEVLKVLLNVVNENKEILQVPPPKALFDAFGESTLKFRLLFWVHFQNGIQAKSDVSIAVYAKFSELGIKIPVPQREIYLSQDDDSSKENLSNN